MAVLLVWQCFLRKQGKSGVRAVPLALWEDPFNWPVLVSISVEHL